MLEKITRFVVRFMEICSCTLLLSLALSVLFGIADRFLFHIGLAWPEEFARFMFIWLGPLTAAILVQRREHFDFSNLVDKLLDEGTKGRQIYEVLISSIMVGLMILLVIFGLKFAEFARYHKATSIRISMSYVYLSIPIGAIFIIFFYVVNIYNDIKKIKRLKNQ